MAPENAVTENLHEGDVLIARLKTPKLREREVVHKVQSELNENIEKCGVKDVILDFQEVAFIGSIAFLAFLSLKRIPSVERVIICNLDGNIREMFSICKLIPSASNQPAPFLESDSVESALKLCSSC